MIGNGLFCLGLRFIFHCAIYGDAAIEPSGHGVVS